MKHKNSLLLVKVFDALFYFWFKIYRKGNNIHSIILLEQAKVTIFKQ